ncbi:MAG: tRNA pseudouridine(55) synthase TruB, partial [Acidobacteriota bacterium]
MKRQEMMKDGLLLVDKHAGCTSHDIVAAARRILRQKKIGHCGTLDPAATGLLLLTAGRATRLTRFLIRAPKVYEGAIRFGITTDTYDTAGEVTATGDTEGLTHDAIARGMERFVGVYLQSPPPYCAKKVGGVKFYELARRGEQVPDAKKEVTIFELSALEDWQPGHDLRFRLGCSSGTYARSVAHELGEQLGCGGALSGLRRSGIGAFQLADAITLDELRAWREQQQEARDSEDDSDLPLPAAWIPFDSIPLPFDEVVADVQQERRIQHG